MCNNYITTPCQYGSKSTHQGDSGTQGQEKHATRNLRYAMRDEVRKMLWKTNHYTTQCGQKSHERGGFASIIRNSDGNVFFSGLVTCSNVWTCPVCAAKIANRRRDEVKKAIDGHWQAGGRVYMLALTTDHYRGQGLWSLKQRITKSWGRLIQSASFKNTKQKYGISGYIRALEVTASHKNGWHPLK